MVQNVTAIIHQLLIVSNERSSPATGALGGEAVFLQINYRVGRPLPTLNPLRLGGLA
jgi:hypothetical protein